MAKAGWLDEWVLRERFSCPSSGGKKTHTKNKNITILYLEFIFFWEKDPQEFYFNRPLPASGWC
jgi:hypothetical protein